MPGKIKQKSQDGFSLIEVVITLFVIGVILVIYQAALNTVFLVRNSHNQEIALRVANNKIEELRAGGYAALPGNGAFTDAQLSGLPGSSAIMTFSDFNSSTKQVDITIQWQETGADSVKSLSLTTLIAKIGGL